MRLLLGILLLSAQIAFGAVSFDHTTNGTATKVSGVPAAAVSGVPSSMCARVNISATGIFQIVVVLTNKTNDNEFFYLGVIDTQAARADTDHGGSSAAATTSTTIGATGVWHAICGVWSAVNSRAVYLDTVASKQTNSTRLTPTGIESTAVGYLYRLNPTAFTNGLVADVGIWSVALSDAEVGMYMAGFSPSCARRDSLVGYYLMLSKVSPEPDISSSTIANLTYGSGTATAAHPQVFYCQ